MIGIIMLFKNKTEPKYDRKMYEEELEHLDELIFYAVGVSDAVGGIKVPQRYVIATQLFTRIVSSSITFFRILPANRFLIQEPEWWDWASVASLGRNIIETYHAFFYVGIEKISDDEVKFRLDLMQLHRNSEKYRLYKEIGIEDSQLRDFEEGLPLDKQHLKDNKIFQSLPEKYQSELLKGKTAMHLSHSEIHRRADILSDSFKPIYRLLSNQVHSTPFASQAQSDERGRGFENDTERYYIILIIQVVSKILLKSIMSMVRIFPGKLKALPFIKMLIKAKFNLKKQHKDQRWKR